MKQFEALCRESVKAGVGLADKDAALREVAALAKRCEALADVPEADILNGLREREKLGTTGFGGGVAIPHCRLPDVPRSVVGVLSVPSGVDFDAVDGEPVRLIAFIVGPAEESNEHIYLLSAISQGLRDEGAVEEMVAADSDDGLAEAFVRHVRGEFHVSDDLGHQLFTLVLRNENLFHEVLTVFGGIPSASLTVLSGESSGRYLSRMPLFADVWRGDHYSGTRVILALLNRRVTNEAIRRIERVTGPVRQRSDLLLVVQDVFYAAGALET